MRCAWLRPFPGQTAPPPPPAEEGAIIHFALRTTSTDEATARVRSAGFAITQEPKDVNVPSKPHPTPIRISFCKGPDGEVIEFFQNELT